MATWKLYKLIISLLDVAGLVIGVCRQCSPFEDVGHLGWLIIINFLASPCLVLRSKKSPSYSSLHSAHGLIYFSYMVLIDDPGCRPEIRFHGHVEHHFPPQSFSFNVRSTTRLSRSYKFNENALSASFHLKLWCFLRWVFLPWISYHVVYKPAYSIRQSCSAITARLNMS